ncbi:MAG: S-layer homology domain-containing protein [Defluviitaleaceae bacterium]|nr:S-layer homology domain-containing protein [Defluviitaleaceae bacterium]
MKFMLVLIMILIMATPVFAATPTFRDVPATHFAFEAINWVSDPENGAFMVGDASNNFHPSRHINKFEASQIYAMAAGFRHVTAALPHVKREEISRSFETWRPFLESMSEEYASWNRAADREIAFLLYRGILSASEVQNFVTRTGNTETRPLLTREQAVAWMVRLVGQAAHAQTITLPHHTPFRDDANISNAFRRYVYHAREIGIIHGAGGYMNPTAHFTRAEMATVFHNTLATEDYDAPEAGSPASVVGEISNVHLDTHVSITTPSGTNTFSFAQNAVILIDNVQRTPPFLREGMAVTALIDANRQVVSLRARSAAEAELSTSEGIVINVNARESVTILTERVRIGGQVIDAYQVFTFAPNAEVDFAEIQADDFVYFEHNQSVIHSLGITERERRIEGILKDIFPPETSGASPVLLIAEANGRTREFRVMSGTNFTRNNEPNQNWGQMRIGDTITAEVEQDRLARVRATGESTIAEGRLAEIRITDRIAEITVISQSNEIASFFMRTGVFDAFTLRVGAELLLNLESREIASIEVNGELFYVLP